MQIISNTILARTNTVQDIKGFNTQSLVKQAEKKEEQIVSMMPAF